MTELSHDRCSELLSDFVAGRLEGRVAAAVEAHLAACSECRVEEAGLRALLAAGTETMTPEESSLLHQRVAAALSQEAAARARTRRFMPRLAPALAAAAALVLIGAGAIWLGAGTDDMGDAAQGGAAVEDSGDARRGRAEARSADVESQALPASKDGDVAAGTTSAPRPEFRGDLGSISGDDLRALGRTDPLFSAFASSYTVDDAPDRRDDFLAGLSAAAGRERDDVEACAEVLLRNQPGNALLPALAATARLGGTPVVVLGFVTNSEDSRPLDRFILWAWRIDSCSAPPVDAQFGRIQTP